MRYFIDLSYNGTRYSGWQRQPNALSIQEELEKSLSLLLHQNISVTGCGRTDAGVHADQYYAHFEAHVSDIIDLCFSLNKLVSKDIRINTVFPVPVDAHARYSATRRRYHYYITAIKPVFSQEGCWYYHSLGKLNWDRIHSLSMLLSEYDDFKPFCKSDSGVTNYKCNELEATWEVDPSFRHAVLTIDSNRFLRGMVRLIVGTSLFVGQGKLSLGSIRESLDNQSPLEKSYAAPPQGLSLSWIQYPFTENTPVRRSTSCF